jgi:hypothetical protein
VSLAQSIVHYLYKLKPRLLKQEQQYERFVRASNESPDPDEQSSSEEADTVEQLRAELKAKEAILDQLRTSFNDIGVSANILIEQHCLLQASNLMLTRRIRAVRIVYGAAKATRRHRKQKMKWARKTADREPVKFNVDIERSVLKSLSSRFRQLFSDLK